jgi:hypothetical protein
VHAPSGILGLRTLRRLARGGGGAAGTRRRRAMQAEEVVAYRGVTRNDPPRSAHRHHVSTSSCEAFNYKSLTLHHVLNEAPRSPAALPRSNSTKVQLPVSRCVRYPAIGHGHPEPPRRRPESDCPRCRFRDDLDGHARGAGGRRRVVLVAAEVTRARGVQRAEDPERGPVSAARRRAGRGGMRPASRHGPRATLSGRGARAIRRPRDVLRVAAGRRALLCGA